jgi:hypothetical protein
VLVYCTADVSGGHINPAVTFGLFLASKVSLVRAVLYIVAQCLGAICGVGLVKGFQSAFYVRYGGGANELSSGYTKCTLEASAAPGRPPRDHARARSRLSRTGAARSPSRPPRRCTWPRGRAAPSALCFLASRSLPDLVYGDSEKKKFRRWVFREHNATVSIFRVHPLLFLISSVPLLFL